MSTGINWTDETWNPLVGCSKISPGCKNCYAAEAAKSARLQQFEQYQTVKDWNGSIAFVESALEKPFKWKKPKKIFVCSMSDLFHENVTDEMRDRVFAAMALCPQHTFQILTKRPENALKYFEPSLYDLTHRWADTASKHFQHIRFKFDHNYCDRQLSDQIWLEVDSATDSGTNPLRNVWIGTTVENQEMAEKRIPLLLKIPAAKRWLSMEPLLDEVNLLNGTLRIPYTRFKGTQYEEPACDTYQGINLFQPIKEKVFGIKTDASKIDWVVVGGESGASARPCDHQWIESIVNQCQSANVPVWVKQLGSNSVIDDERVKLPQGDRAWSKLENLPQHLQIREFPTP